MKFSQALGFLAIGLTLAALPHLAPRLLVGNPARELWLALMSWLQIGIGAASILGHALSLLGQLMRYDPTARQLAETPVAALPWEPESVEWSTQETDTFPAVSSQSQAA